MPYYMGMEVTMVPKFKPGTKFSPTGKDYVCTVVDVWVTTNLKGEVVRLRYVATHEFLGQTITDCDVLETTIARGLLQEA